MAIVIDRQGEALHWEPTTELLCSYCREAFPIERQSWGKVNFMFDVGVPEPLADGEYWYFHKRCSYITNHLQVRWGWLSIARLLGFTYDGKKRSPNKIQKDIQQRMPPNCYDRLYEQWRPALGLPKASRPVQKMITPPAPKIIKVPAPTIVKPKMLRPGSGQQVQRKSWQALRFQIMQRDGFRCLLCGIAAKDGPEVRLEVDHIIPRSRGGTNAAENLWTLCYDCNRGKGVQDL